MSPAFVPPPDWVRISAVDAHTAGEPLRVVTGGFPELVGDTMLEKRRHARRDHDHLRRALMLEPRGHADMYGCVLTPPVTEDGDVGVLFLHNEGYSTMCGHGIIGLVAVGLECGLIQPGGDGATVRIDTPAGRVTAAAAMAGGRVSSVSFRNVPSFVVALDQAVEVEGLGEVRCDVAFGGAFYAYVDAHALGVAVAPEQATRLIELGRRIKRAVSEQLEVVYPGGDPDLNFLYGTIFTEAVDGPAHSRNVCVFADGEVDRSPTGTGVSGRAAILHARGEVSLGEAVEIESLIGTSFEVRPVEVTSVGELPAVVPEVVGAAYITGVHEFVIDPRDPLRDGFMLR